MHRKAFMLPSFIKGELNAPSSIPNVSIPHHFAVAPLESYSIVTSSPCCWPHASPEYYERECDASDENKAKINLRSNVYRKLQVVPSRTTIFDAPCPRFRVMYVTKQWKVVSTVCKPKTDLELKVFFLLGGGFHDPIGNPILLRSRFRKRVQSR